MRCSSLAVPSVTSVSACVWPRVKSPEPCVRGRHPDLGRDRADLVGRAAVGPALLDRDLLAHDLLVDRVGRGARVAARERVELAVDARREGQLQLLLDPRVERGALGRLELLGVLLGVGQLAQRLAELRVDRRLDGLVAALLADRRDRRAHLHAAHHVGLGRVAGDAGELGRGGLGLGLRDAGEPVLGQQRVEARGVLGVDLGLHALVLPLGLADLGAQVELRLAERLDRGVRGVERLQHDVLGHFLGARLDHRDGVHRAAHDQVEIGAPPSASSAG